MKTGSVLAIITAFLTALTCGSCSRCDNNWSKVKGIPGKFHGEFKMERLVMKNGPEQLNSGDIKDIATFAIGRECVFPMMFPDAYWISLSIEVDKSNDKTIRILTHTANQPKSEAKYAYLTMTDPSNIKIDLPNEEVSFHLVKMRELTVLFKDL